MNARRVRRFVLGARLGIAGGAWGALALAGACGNGHVPQGSVADATSGAEDASPFAAYDGLPEPDGGPRTAVAAEFVSTRVFTGELMFAAGEMQTSGEPFAQNFAGRDLNHYDRYYIPVDQYLLPSSTGRLFDGYTDLFGFSSAVESYEYSKYHVNMIAHQTGAGVSLANGPLLASLPGATPRDRLRARVEGLLHAAGTDVAGYAHFDGGAPVGTNPLNDFGFAGLWPTLIPYEDFDATMDPDDTIVHSCTTASGYGGVIFFGSNPVYAYECAYNSLNLPNRAAQIHTVIGPETLGFATWKYALWGIDFTGRLHDASANGVTAVAPQDQALVGTLGNQVLPVEPPYQPGATPGVFVGSTPLEGMWGLLFVTEADNAASWLLSSLGTSDGATLGGFSSIEQAIRYDYTSPLVWFPTSLSVQEDSVLPYPGITSVAIQDPSSQAVALAALAQGYSLLFGMTDPRNVAVGQQIGCQIEFAGSVFPADDGLPDGESSPHDRALAIMRAAFVDLDRIHVDPATQTVVDSASLTGGALVRGSTVSATSLGHVVIGLRHLLMGCNAAISQYGAPDPDVTKDAQGILNSVPIHPYPGLTRGQPSFSTRVRQVLMSQAAFVRDVLTAADGTVADGATLAKGVWTPTAGAASVESQGAALRVLVEAWFLTQDTSYRDRARAVARQLLTAFWSEPLRMFRQTAGGADDIVMTPERFAWLQQALRETYEGVWLPGDPLLDRNVLATFIARVNKLYLNGWDDLNGNQRVDKPAECLGARLQMGEQALTGEVGTTSNGVDTTGGADREGDCVENIGAVQIGDAGPDAHVGSLLASQVHFHAAP
jgi:hypothetical protein